MTDYEEHNLILCHRLLKLIIKLYYKKTKQTHTKEDYFPQRSIFLHFHSAYLFGAALLQGEKGRACLYY